MLSKYLKIVRNDVFKTVIALLLGSTMAGAYAAESASAETEAAPAERSRTIDASAFKLILDRNIFNPNRRAGRSETANNSAPRPARVDTLTLWGTLIDKKDSLAFVDGSQTGRKALKVADTIAGFRVAEIDWGYVKLVGTDSEFELPVGRQLLKREGENWRLVESAGAGLSTVSSAGSTSAEDDELVRKLMEKRTREAGEPIGSPPADEPEPAAPSGSSSASGETDDVVRKLMEKRAQEVNK